MAECRRETTRAEPVVTYPPVVVEIVLRLTEDEASLLRQLMNKIGGNPDGPRNMVDSIGKVLFLAGVELSTHKIEIHTGFGTYLRVEKREGE